MSLVTDYDPQLAAAKGAALCDVIDPEWAEEIDTRRLKMQDACACIGGQLCNDFEELAASFGGDNEKLAEYGFCLPIDPDDRWSRLDYWSERTKAWRRLTNYWKREIDRRLP